MITLFEKYNNELTARKVTLLLKKFLSDGEFNPTIHTTKKNVNLHHPGLSTIFSSKILIEKGFEIKKSWNENAKTLHSPIIQKYHDVISEKFSYLLFLNKNFDIYENKNKNKNTYFNNVRIHTLTKTGHTIRLQVNEWDKISHLVNKEEYEIWNETKRFGL